MENEQRDDPDRSRQVSDRSGPAEKSKISECSDFRMFRKTGKNDNFDTEIKTTIFKTKKTVRSSLSVCTGARKKDP